MNYYHYSLYHKYIVSYGFIYVNMCFKIYLKFCLSNLKVRQAFLFSQKNFSKNRYFWKFGCILKLWFIGFTPKADSDSALVRCRTHRRNIPKGCMQLWKAGYHVLASTAAVEFLQQKATVKSTRRVLTRTDFLHLQEVMDVSGDMTVNYIWPNIRIAPNARDRAGESLQPRSTTLFHTREIWNFFGTARIGKACVTLATRLRQQEKTEASATAEPIPPTLRG